MLIQAVADAAVLCCRAVPPSSVPATHSGDADHGCGYGMAAVDHNAGNSAEGRPHGTADGRGRTSKPSAGRDRSPEFTAHAPQSTVSRADGSLSLIHI